MIEQKVEAVERAFAILEAFADGSGHLTLGEIAARTDLHRSTILRLSASMIRFGYLTRDDDGRFRLGASLWRLGILYQSSFELADYVRPVLQSLVEQTGQTAAFYIREGDKRICLYRLHAKRLLRRDIGEGGELPLDRGSGGHVLVAYTGGNGVFYDDLRKRGYSINIGEGNPDSGGVSAPVFGARSRFVGALGVTGPKENFEEPVVASLVAAVTAAANMLSNTISGS